MKKTVIIAILLIYLGSIVLVNFFGLNVKNFEGTKYVESITCEVIHRGEDPKEIKAVQDPTDDVVWQIFDFIPGYYDETNIDANPNTVQILPHVYPETADNTEVKLIYDKETTSEYCHVNETAKTVTFLEPDKGITIEIVSADGSNIKTRVFILPRTPKH
ncbi:MAG: hypothetical protein IKB20_03075 [Clostridia bacterium]|nr:hypothetical protein [Clostridia bacterium]